MRAALLDAWRALRARPAATLIAQGGVALALAAGLLVALLALAMARVDEAIPDPERIVLLDFKGNVPGMPSPWFGSSPVFIGPALKRMGVPLQQIARTQDTSFTVRRAGGDFHSYGLLLADPELAPLMGLRSLHGDLQQTLNQPDAIAITPTLVEQLWGALPPAQALGRMLSDRGQSFRVAAIVPDFDPRHPLSGFELIAGFESRANRSSAEDREAIFMANGRVFARLRPGAKVEAVGGWMRTAFRAHPGFAQLPRDWTQNREAAFFRGMSLPQTRFEGQSERWMQVGALGAACALLLLLASINALNLQAAQLLQRQRETALRQSLGASRFDMLRLWAAEQGLALLGAGAFASLLAWWAAPGLVAWLDLPARTQLFQPLPWAVIGGAAGVLVLLLPLSLGLPAWLALRQAPARALQGRTASEGPWGRRARQTLLAAQLGGALLLLALSAVLTLQHRHLLQADHGFSLEQRLLLDVFAGEGERERLVPLVEAIARDPSVQSWAFSDMVPPWGANGRREHYRRAASSQGLLLLIHRTSPSFFTTFGMQVLAGDPRQAVKGETRVVVDANAARELGFARPQDAVGQLVLGGGGFAQPGQDPRRIVAVVAPARLETGRETAPPRVFELSDDFAPFLTLHGRDAGRMRDNVAALWKRFDLPFAYHLEPLQQQRVIAYRPDGQLAGLLGALALLAVAVAAAGAYALVADTLRRRRTELVLRRLHGAAGRDIVRQVASEFALPLMLALALALPLAAWIGRIYRSEFIAPLPLLQGLLLPLLAAAGLTLLMVALSAWRHTRLALRLRPIEALV